MKSYLHEPAATVATGTTRKAAITGTTAAATAASRAASAPVCCSGEWKALSLIHISEPTRPY